MDGYSLDIPLSDELFGLLAIRKRSHLRREYFDLIHSFLMLKSLFKQLLPVKTKIDAIRFSRHVWLVGGLAEMDPSLTIFNIEKVYADSSLPSTSTCNSLSLPDYSSLQITMEKVSLAIHEGNRSFQME